MKPRKSQDRLIADLQHREAVGERLRVTREALHAGRAEWCAQYQIGMSQICQWETGKHYPDVLFLIQLCDEHSLTLDWFLRGVTAVGPVLVKAVSAPVRAETAWAAREGRRRSESVNANS